MPDRQPIASAKRTYVSYLLRLWRRTNGHGLTWHASLESPAEGTRMHFGNLQALFDFLEAETGMNDDS